MNLIDYSQSFLALLPPVIALTLAILTRKVMLSLGVGIVLGAFLLTDYSLLDSVTYIVGQVSAVIIDGDGINTWNMSIVAFLLLLGMMTALLTLSGGTRAFAQWAQRKVKTQRGSKLLAAFLGVFIFVDDYFNSLAVGAIARPVTDKLKVSRSKLAYILDSTAAPMCVIMPASSWGAYIMTIVGGILISHGITEYSAIGAYMRLVPMNFYAIFALLMVFAVAWFKLDVGQMKAHEQASAAKLDQSSEQDDIKDLQDDLDIKESQHGRVADLLLPIIMLIIATVSFMLWTGAQALTEQGQAFSLLGAFENTDVGRSLVYGALIGLAMALVTVVRQALPVKDTAKTLWIGAKSMFGAIVILLFAWTIGSVISDMKTGSFLSTLVQGSIAPEWLPVLLFLLSGAMAFSTGTSWGTFGIMLPIAGDMSAASDISLMLPMLSAVLAGSVFGDHCSPISDTTILSSTGARCHHIDHVATQLPYALIVALISSLGFIVLGFTDSISLSLLTCAVAFVISCLLLSRISQRQG